MKLLVSCIVASRKKNVHNDCSFVLEEPKRELQQSRPFL